MTLPEYQSSTIRTLAYTGDKRLDLAHMVLGVHSEFHEFQDAIENNDPVNIGEEIADKFWYISNHCNFRNYSLQELYDQTAPVNSTTRPLSYYTSKWQDILKKEIIYNKQINLVEEKIQIVSILSILKHAIKTFNLDLEVILENNINKLKIRYPDKFSEDLANNRDLESERKELEKN